jgi:hypothetical protein
VRPLLPGDKEQPGTILGMADPKRPANDSEAITWLVEQVPELRPLLEEHLAESELLSYVVFESDLLRWFVEGVRRGDHEPARRFIEAIEPVMTTPSSRRPTTVFGTSRASA